MPLLDQSDFVVMKKAFHVMTEDNRVFVLKNCVYYILQFFQLGHTIYLFPNHSTTPDLLLAFHRQQNKSNKSSSLTNILADAIATQPVKSRQ